jgi:hypothetical protein
MRVQIFANTSFGQGPDGNVNFANPPDPFTADNRLEVVCFSDNASTTTFTVAATGLVFNPAGPTFAMFTSFYGQVFISDPLPGGVQPQINVSCDGGPSQSGDGGLQCLCSEFSGLVATGNPYVQNAFGEAAFSPATATMSGITVGNLVTVAQGDLSSGITSSATLNTGILNPGENTGWTQSFWGGDWISSPATSLTATESTSDVFVGFVRMTEYMVASSAPTNDVNTDSTDF